MILGFFSLGEGSIDFPKWATVRRRLPFTPGQKLDYFHDPHCGPEEGWHARVNATIWVSAGPAGDMTRCVWRLGRRPVSGDKVVGQGSEGHV